MKFLQGNLLVAIFIILFVIGAVIFFLTKNVSAEIGNIQVFSGNAQIITGSKTSDAKTGQGVKVKDSIKVSSGSKVSIVLKDSSVIRLDENTEVDVGELTYKDQKIKDANFKLITGRLWSRVAPLPQNGNFEVETPTVVASIRGTSFNTTYLKEITGVYVDRKKVDVLLRRINETQIVPESLVLRMRNENIEEDFKKGPQIPDPKYFDEWIKFNQEEDSKICKDNPKTPGCEDEDFSSPPTSSQTPTPSNSPAVKGIYKPQSVSPKISPSVTPTQAPTTTSRPTQTSNPTSPQTPTHTPTPTPIPKKLVDFQISHNTQNECYTSCQFSALAYFDDNPNKSVDVTKDTKWSLQLPAKGTISAFGFYTSGNVRGDTVQGEYNNNQNHATANHLINPQSTIN